MDRRFSLPWMLATCAGLCTGCSGPLFRPQSPEPIAEQLIESDARLIAEITHPHGMKYVKVEAVGLVTGLSGTGSDPPPSPQRASLLGEMKRREVPHPSRILASEDTSLVLARGYLRPGLQKGDRIDIEVRSPTRSATKSLRGGSLLETRLTELAVLDQKIRTGHVLALAEGPVLVDPQADSSDPSNATKGRVLSGGVAMRSRPLGLIMDQPYQSVRTTRQVGKAINVRFHSFQDGRKVGVATPKTDSYVELMVHPRYQHNVARYMRVVRQIALDETAQEQQARLVLLGHQLQDPLTAATAALRLEAIGTEQAKSILEEGLQADDPEVRFYTAEALAYLDATSAVELLADAARNEPAFRINALAALRAMDDPLAYDALRSLLETKSAETCYGAFRALWAMNPHDPLVHGEDLGAFSYHVLDDVAQPMIHVTRSRRPEVVLFGGDQQLRLPIVADAGRRIIVNGLSGETITISRFVPGEPKQKRVVSTSLDEVIRAIVELGGSYPDVVQLLMQAKQKGSLACRLRVDALPEAGRQYARGETPQQESDAALASSFRLTSPLPDLFQFPRR